MHRKFCVDMSFLTHASRQTDRHTHCNILYPTRGWSNNVRWHYCVHRPWLPSLCLVKSEWDTWPQGQTQLSVASLSDTQLWSIQTLHRAAERGSSSVLSITHIAHALDAHISHNGWKWLRLFSYIKCKNGEMMTLAYIIQYCMAQSAQ